MPLSLTWPAFPDEGTTNYNSAARTSLLALLANGDAIETVVDAHSVSIGALAAGSGAVVSADDTTVGVLDGKLLAGAGISLTVGNPAGNETLTIAQVAATASVFGGIKVGTGLAIDGGGILSAGVPSRVNHSHTDSPVTLVAADCTGLKTFTNTTAAAELIMNLPAGADGYRLSAIVTAAYDFSFVPNGTEIIRYLGTISKAGGKIKSAEIGHTIQLEWNGTQWVATIAGSLWNLETS